MNKALFIKKYSFILGLALFCIILFRSNPEAIFQNIKNVNLFYLFLAALFGLFVISSKALCWNYIKRQQNIKYSFKDSFLMYAAGMYVGALTPGRLGEIAKALYLKKDGHSLGKSLVSAILDRLSDFAFLLVFILFGSLFFLVILQKQILIMILGIAVAVLLFVIFLKIGLLKWGLNKLFNIFIPFKYQKSWKINFQDFINDFKIYKFKNYLIIFLITAFSWAIYYTQMYILAKGINLNIPFLYLAISVAVAGFITLIPISIFGIGTRDAALILLFSPLLILKEQTIVFSSLILFVSLFAVLIGLICWLIKPIKI